jgi:hypothetical protein
MNTKARHKTRTRWLVVAGIISLGLILAVSWLWNRPPSALSDAIAARNPQWSPDGAYLVSECAFDVLDYSYPDHEVCLSKPDLSG